VGGIFCDLEKVFVAAMTFYCLNWNFMEQLIEIMYFVNLSSVIDIMSINIQ